MNSKIVFLKKIRIVLFVFIILLTCLKAKRSPFDTSSPQGLGNALGLSSLLTGAGIGTRTSLPILALSFNGSPFSFIQSTVITTITPTVTGSVTSCSSSPALPTGLIINNTTCAISGTPTSVQTVTSYIITASNSAGNATATISITVLTNIALSWTRRTNLPSSISWRSVAFGNGVFVTVAASSSTAATSPDGITWTARTLPSSANWQSVTFGNGVFVAVSAGGSTVAATSPDGGITWIQRTLPTPAEWQSVTFGNGVFTAVADGPSTAAATSPDGINWTARTLPSSAQWSSVAFGNGVFVAVAAGPSNVAATSPDGINWSARTLQSSALWRSVTFGDGVFVAFAFGGNTVARSLDGNTWTGSTIGSANWQAVTFGNGIFVAVTTNTFDSATSP